MSYLAFDIETAICDDAQALFDTKEYKPDQQLTAEDPPAKILELKTPELREARIQEWKENQQHKIRQNIAIKRQKDIDHAAINWWTGKVISITTIDEKGGTRTYMGPDEKIVLSRFFYDLVSDYPHHHLLGKSGEFFDIPFLVGRAMRHNLGLPRHLRRAREPLTDINRIFGQSDNHPQVTSLAHYCHGLKLPGKLAHGSDVKGWYALTKTGEDDMWLKIAEYNIHDTMLVAMILERYEKEFKAHSYADAHTEKPVVAAPGKVLYLSKTSPGATL